MVEASPHVVMTLITTTKIDGVLQRMGVVFGVLEISLCVHVERKIVVRTIHILYSHPYMKSLHKSNKMPADMAPTSLISGTFQTAST